MKKYLGLIAVFAFGLMFASCKKMMSENESIDQSALTGKNDAVGQVYTLNNNASENRVMVWNRGVDGMLSFRESVSTGGAGSGGGLGSQGAVVLNGNWLIAVNAGSNSISSMKASPKGLEWVSTTASGGITPISLTTWGNWVYVLNAGGDGNISGFMLDGEGMLHAIPNSTRPLSSSSSGPAQVQFVNGGTALVVTEKATNKIISYTVQPDGTPGMYHEITSANTTPFGFDEGMDGVIYVSEAGMGMPGASTVSSYHIGMDGSISLIDGPISAGQTAACWVVLNNNAKYAYATNTGSNNISSFSAQGTLSVLEAAAGMGNAPTDAAFSNNSKYLYVLNSGNGTFGVFSVGNDGSLQHIQTMMNIPASAVGLAAK